jgi:RimJ/RimL family protein N-acetyltransferase
MSITLREIHRDDLSIINQWRNDKAVIDMLGNNFIYIAQEIDDRWYDAYLASRDKNVRLAIITDDTKKYIGNVNLTAIHPINRSAEFSIFIGDKSGRGKGYGYEATVQMLKHGFSNLNLNRIWLTVLAENIPAQNLYLKLGFVKEGVERQSVYKNGKFSDVWLMAILKEEFKNNL